MQNIPTFIEQVRQFLIKSEDSLNKVELYNRFINECKSLNLSEADFYKKILKEAHSSINWEAIEEAKKQKIETQKRLDEAIKEKEVQIQNAPTYINRLIKIAFEDEVVESEELIKIFEKASSFSQDINKLAVGINTLLDKHNYKSYPRANLDAPTLKDTLISSNWYSDRLYQKLTTPPPPPPVPFPWAKVIVAVLLFGITGTAIGYFAWYKPYMRDKNAPRYYTFANDVILRSSAVSGVDNNKIETLPYGSELITYDYGSEWTFAKNSDREGYISSKLILNKKDFYLLNSIFGDNESKGVIESAKCRKALLKYFTDKNFIGKIDSSVQKDAFGEIKNTNEIWQVFAKDKSIKPNSVAFPRVVSPSSKFSDFAVVIKNVNTNARKFLLFSFADDETPSLTFEQDAPLDGDIKDVKKYFQAGKLVYDVKYSNGNTPPPNLIGSISNTPNSHQVVKPATPLSSTSNHIPGRFPFASERILTSSDISGLSKQDLKIMLNEIYARYGYKFSESELILYFDNQPWYQPKNESVYSLLNPIEKKNIAFLSQYEKN